jgi:hypothetical protein
MLCYTALGPEAMESSDHGMPLLNPGTKQTFLIRGLSQAFCHSDRTLTNIPGLREMEFFFLLLIGV